MHRGFLLLVLLPTLPGCEWLNETLGWGPGRPDGDDEPWFIETGWRETGDFGDPEVWWPEPIIQSVSATCTNRDDVAELLATVETSGWNQAVALEIVASGTDDRAERFRFPPEALVGRCGDGTCDAWEHTLVQGDEYSDEGATMTLNCTDLQASDRGWFSRAAFRMETVPEDGQFDVQCAMWGHRSRELFGDDCECFEAFLADRPDDPCGSHDQEP